MANRNNEDTPQGNKERTPQSPGKKTSSSRKTDPVAGSRPKKKLDTAEEKVEAVARKAKTTAKKVAAAVSGTVKEIAEKVSARKTGSSTKTDASTTSRTRKAAGGLAAKTTASKRTKAGALSAELSDREIADTIGELPSSDAIRGEEDITDESPTDVKEHFFHDQHVHAGPPPPQAPRDLPDEYDDTKLVLLVRDPEWIYAYWEINDATRQELNLPREGHTNRLVLRLFKITARQWPHEAAHYFFDIDLSNDARSWYVRLPEPNEAWCAELGIIDDEQNYIAVCRSNEIITPRNTLSDHVDSDWMIVEESFEKITRMSGADMAMRLRGESHTASESILKHLHRQLTGVLHGERAAMSSGLFSEQAVPPVGKDFWLQVHTELILYGATEPDAQVTVQGQPVELNPDGTFSLRFSLPDGEQVLEVRARNNSGDREEQITPVVVRTTRR